MQGLPRGAGPPPSKEPAIPRHALRANPGVASRADGDPDRARRPSGPRAPRSPPSSAPVGGQRDVLQRAAGAAWKGSTKGWRDRRIKAPGSAVQQRFAPPVRPRVPKAAGSYGGRATSWQDAPSGLERASGGSWESPAAIRDRAPDCNGLSSDQEKDATKRPVGGPRRSTPGEAGFTIPTFLWFAAGRQAWRRHVFRDWLLQGRPVGRQVWRYGSLQWGPAAAGTEVPLWV